MPSYLDIATEIARDAGALLANYFERRIGYELKGDYDLVTAADRASEKLVIERLRSHFPSHAIIGEESGAHAGTSDYCWYVDPLDGTTNFAHGFPIFSVTLGLEKAGEMVAGLVFDPLRGEMFAAEKGAGACLNNRSIRVSKTPRVEESLLATGFPSRKRHSDVNVHFFYQMAMASHGVRRAGSAAIDLAYVASGRLDAFWEFGLNPWDMAAGILLIQEAGGTVTDMRGGPVSLRGEHILASNTLVHQGALGLIGEVFDGRIRVAMPGISR